jgi:hypothetical protein
MRKNWQNIRNLGINEKKKSEKQSVKLRNVNIHISVNLINL